MEIINKIKQYCSILGKHILVFWFPWVIIATIAVASIFFDEWNPWLLWGSTFVFVLVLCFKPMNIIYGLIGTRGDPKIFFVMFFIINFLFSQIYYRGFLKDAGITYDLNQAHIEFGIFENVDKTVENRTSIQGELEMLPENRVDSIHYYHRIDYDWVLRNTLLTSLMQEPTEFFSATSTYSGNHQATDGNMKKAQLFHWLLVFHILISWILLGVFISLIYQKFRNM